MLFPGLFFKGLVFPIWGIPDFAGILGDYEMNEKYIGQNSVENSLSDLSVTVK